MNVGTVLQALATLAWIGVIALIIISIVRASRRQPFKGAPIYILVTAVIAIVLTTVSAGLVFVQPEQRGVVISAVAPQGYREEALQPGLRWILPYLENVVFYPISQQTYTMSIADFEGQREGDDSVSARTADGQEVLVDASVIYAVDPSQVIQVHIDWQTRYTDDLVRPLARGIIRSAVSQYGIEEVYSTQRDALTDQISETLREKLLENGLQLSNFVLRNITFSPEYAASVEQKQIAEQQAQQAFFVVEQRRQEAEQARQAAQGQADSVVIRAEGDADARLIQAEAEAAALDLLAAALAEKPELLTYQYINELAPGIRVMLVPNDNPFLLPLPSLESLAGPVTVQPAPEPTPLPTPEPTPETQP
jgi:regulator of protease activity HflC (stomatin/prohibitin superfamily)